MPIELLVILSVLMLILSIGLFFNECIDSIVVIVVFGMFVFLLVWIIISLAQPLKVENVEYYDVSTLSTNDGKKVQFIFIDGKCINVTERFGVIFSDDAKIKKEYYVQWYYGIYYASCKPTLKIFGNPISPDQ